MLRRLAITPFEAAISVLLIVSGIAQLAGLGFIDPLTALLPYWEALSFGYVTVGTGVLMLAGTAIALRGVEIAGLLMLIAVIFCRFLVYGAYLGYGVGFLVTGIFDLAIIGAALTRLAIVIRRQSLVRISGGNDDRI